MGPLYEKTFGGVINLFVNTITVYLVPIIIGFAVLVFLYGIYTFIMSAGDEEKRKDGKKFMFYGIIGLFVMVSVWGLVRIVTNTFDFRFGLPQLKESGPQQNYQPTPSITNIAS